MYIRLSREDGDDRESESVENQRDIITNFIESKEDLELVDEYVTDLFVALLGFIVKDNWNEVFTVTTVLFGVNPRLLTGIEEPCTGIVGLQFLTVKFFVE